jgi:hypothetical protein
LSNLVRRLQGVSDGILNYMLPTSQVISSPDPITSTNTSTDASASGNTTTSTAASALDNTTLDLSDLLDLKANSCIM